MLLALLAVLPGVFGLVDQPDSSAIRTTVEPVDLSPLTTMGSVNVDYLQFKAQKVADKYTLRHEALARRQSFKHKEIKRQPTDEAVKRSLLVKEKRSRHLEEKASIARRSVCFALALGTTGLD